MSPLRLPVWVALVAAAVLSGCLQRRPSTEDDPLGKAQTALRQQDYATAETLASSITQSASHWGVSRLVAGEAASKAGRIEAALDYYRQLAQHASDPLSAAEGCYFQGEVLRQNSRLAEAETSYRAALDKAPGNVATHQRLAFVLSSTGRRWEAAPHYLAVVQSGTASLEDLVLLADLDRPLEQPEFLANSLKQAPQDEAVRLGLALQAINNSQTDDAEQWLLQIPIHESRFLAAAAMLAEIRIHRGNALPTATRDLLTNPDVQHPEIWFVRGLIARAHNPTAAARCFYEAVKQEPTYRRAMHHWGQMLKQLGRAEAGPAMARAEELTRLTQDLDQLLRSKFQSEVAFQNIVRNLSQSGRIWEACAWLVHGRERFPNSIWVEEDLSRLAPALQPDLPQVHINFDLARQFPGNSLPVFRPADMLFPKEPSLDVTAKSSIPRFTLEPHFPRFLFENGTDPTTPGARQFEQTGGGVAVLDFDGDGWPDLFLTQGLQWETGAQAPTPHPDDVDTVVRNVGGQRWQTLPQDVLPSDTEFGQGCAVGDINEDGFPDLYIANVFQNQLLLNNGDGTFHDATRAGGITEKSWTVSCAIADLNADGIADLVDVNYLQGPELFQRICQGKACSPSQFEGAPDRVWLGTGDGRFNAWSPTETERDGKGLGIIVFEEPNSPRRPSLYIANDQTPSFLMRNATAGNQFQLQMTNEGFAAGLAVNENGLAMAAMGIAAEDMNNDSFLDFYVTTFDNESSIMYQQVAPGLFQDIATPSGLGAPSLSNVGWGTQFLDADNDGDADLVVANGHVDDYRDTGGKYAMHAQYFQNLGQNRFVEVPSQTLGDWFAQEHIGRALARLDWNRDGRMDFAVTMLAEPMALLTNHTNNVGRFLTLQLVARQTCRDAIGTRVKVSSEGRVWHKQLVAGDGYQASNERRLHIGLGTNLQTADVTIEWPSGATTTLKQIPVDRPWLVREGHRTAWETGHDTTIPWLQHAADVMSPP